MNHIKQSTQETKMENPIDSYWLTCSSIDHLGIDDETMAVNDTHMQATGYWEASNYLKAIMSFCSIQANNLSAG